MEAKSAGWRVTALGAAAPTVWGTTYIVTTQLLPAHHPMTAGVLRAVPAGLLLVGFTHSRPQEWRRLLLLALLNIGAFFPLLFIAAYRLPGGLAAVVGAGQPFAVAAFAWALGLGKTPARQMMWAAIAVIGVGLTMVTGTMVLDSVGLIAAVAGTICMGLGITLTRAWGPTEGLSGLASTGWQLLLGGLMILPLIPLLDSGPFALTGKAIAGYAWLSLVGGVLAYSLWFFAARRLPAASSSLLLLLSPVTAAAIGWVFLGQVLAPIQSAGFALALVASVLGQRRPFEAA